MRASEVPSPAQLVAHLDTAFDAARHWMQRGLQAQAGDAELWENATYFPRILLTRASDTLTQLGYALRRDHDQAPDDDTRGRLADSAVAWLTVQPALARARDTLQVLRESEPDWPGAREGLAEAKAHLDEAAQGVRVMFIALDVERDRNRFPGQRALSLAPEPDRADDLDVG